MTPKVSGPGEEAKAREVETLAARLAEAEAKVAEAEAKAVKAEAKAAEAEAKAQENWDHFLRARADLDNYRRRVERDLAAMVRRGKKDLLLRLLEVADALERAVLWEEAAGAGQAGGPAAGRQATSAPGDASRVGVAQILRQLVKVLADEGVTPIQSVGLPFDPALHEAVDVTFDAKIEGPTVVTELERGYRHGDEVLRPARVRVAQPPS